MFLSPSCGFFVVVVVIANFVFVFIFIVVSVIPACVPYPNLSTFLSGAEEMYDTKEDIALVDNDTLPSRDLE